MIKQQRDGNSNRSLIILLLIIFSVSLIYAIGFRNDHNWGGDFSQYIAQAKSLSDGSIQQFIENTTFRYEKSDDKRLGPKYYPWGFPLILTPVYHFFGLHPMAMKAFISLFFLSSLAIIYLIFKDKICHAHNLLIVAAIAYSPYCFKFKDNILSDMPFLFFTLLAILSIQQVILRKNYLWNDVVSYSIIGLLIFCSYTIRSSGLVLLPTLFIAQVKTYEHIKKDCEHIRLTILKHVLPYAVFLLLTMFLIKLLPHENTYADILSFWGADTILGNMIYYAKLPSSFFKVLMPQAGKIIYIITIPFVFMGVIVTFKKDYLYHIFLFLTVCLHIIWPGKQGLRYIFPIMPFYLYFLVSGLNKFNDFIPKLTDKTKITIVAGLLLMALFLATIFQSIYLQKKHNTLPQGPYHKDSVELFHYISLNTPQDSSIVFFKPRVMMLYANRKSARIYNYEKIREHDIDYIVSNRNWNRPLKSKNHTAIFSNNSFALYEVKNLE